MIDKESLKMNILEYLKYCNKEKKIKAVGIITDKQAVFFSQIKDNDHRTHEEIALSIEKEIYKDNKRDTFFIHNIHLFSSGDDIIINLPENGELSKAQYLQLEIFLNLIEIYNNQNKKKPITLAIFTPDRKHFNKFDLTNIKEIKKELQELLTKKVTFKEENIIGTTLDKNKITSNIIYHTGIKQCKTIKDLKESLTVCDNYYNDSYYKKYIFELFPDYKEVKDKAKPLSKEIEIDNVTFSNINDKLSNIIIENEYKKLEEKIINNNTLIDGLKKVLRIISIRKKIIENKEELISLYNDDLDLKRIIDNENSKIDELDRQIELKKYSKNLSQKTIDKNQKNLIVGLINIKKNEKLLKVINEYDQNISILKEKKQIIVDKKQEVVNKENAIIDRFSKLSGLDYIPSNFLNIKISKSNLNEETIKKELEKLIKENELLEQELEKVKTTTQNTKNKGKKRN